MQEMVKNQMMFGLGMSASSGAWGPLKNLIAFSMFDHLTKVVGGWWPLVYQTCSRRKMGAPSSVRTPHASIECERSFVTLAPNRQPSQFSIRMDAVVHYVTTLPAMKTLLSIPQHDYLPYEFDLVPLGPDIYFLLKDLKHHDGTLESIRFLLICYEHDVQHLQVFIDTCNVDYERRMHNKLGCNTYYFDQLVATKNKRTVQNPLPTTHLVYTKSLFQTTRTFDNVFFEQCSQVKKRVKFFLNDRSWYDKKGIPYTLGFLFHGEPGCGKTSTVKAIANEGRRHIINIQLSEIKSKAQLHHLFFNEEIHVSDGVKTERYTIPIHERLYVIEDIDAMGDMILRREWKKPETVKKESDDPWMDRNIEEKEVIDLSFLLNLLDGTLESSGRILAITSNFPERIDRALIRPGRIDMIVKFEKCSRKVLRELITNFYDDAFESHTMWVDETMDGKWSPAEANQILFRNFEDPVHALFELHTLNPPDLYGFENGLPSSEIVIPKDEGSNGISS